MFRYHLMVGLVCNGSASSALSVCSVGTFLRGVLDKVGVEPQVQRIGAYKSAGDQLLRRDMSDAQREQLGELLDDIYDNFLTTVAEARGKTREVRWRLSAFCELKAGSISWALGSGDMSLGQQCYQSELGTLTRCGGNINTMWWQVVMYR